MSKCYFYCDIFPSAMSVGFSWISRFNFLLPYYRLYWSSSHSSNSQGAIIYKAFYSIPNHYLQSEATFVKDNIRSYIVRSITMGIYWKGFSWQLEVIWIIDLLGGTTDHKFIGIDIQCWLFWWLDKLYWWGKWFFSQVHRIGYFRVD